MTIAIIGSVALKHHICVDRISADTDVVGDFDSIKKMHKGMDIVKTYPFASGTKYFAQERNGAIIESEIAWESSLSEELLQLILDDPSTITWGSSRTASLDVLYMLKMSHRYLRNSPHFLKTMRDIQLMRKHGAKIRPEHLDFFKRREAATYNYAHPSLKQNKKDFFNDAVQYKYDHDDIHKAIKHLDKPAYSFFKVDEAEVQCSRNKFENCDHKIKLYSVLEEAYVLSLERAIIPHGIMSIKESFDMALMKLSTSISSAWWREWAWEHYDEVQALYNEEYVQRFWKAVEDNLVKLHGE
jgi:hypothetical protein